MKHYACLCFVLITCLSTVNAQPSWHRILEFEVCRNQDYYFQPDDLSPDGHGGFAVALDGEINGLESPMLTRFAANGHATMFRAWNYEPVYSVNLTVLADGHFLQSWYQNPFFVDIVTLQKTDRHGRLIWRYEEELQGSHPIYDSMEQATGNLLMIGRENDPTIHPAVRVVSPEGSLLEVVQLDSNVFNYEYPLAGDCRPDGRYYMAGYCGVSSNNYVVGVWKMNTDHTLMWMERYLTDDIPGVDAVAATPDGGCVVVGASGDLIGDPFVAKFSSGGELEWDHQYTDYHGFFATFNDVQVLPNGDIYAVGFTSYGNTDNIGLLLQLSADGLEIRNETYLLGESTQFFTVYVDPNATVYVAGSIREQNSDNFDAMLWVSGSPEPDEQPWLSIVPVPFFQTLPATGPSLSNSRARVRNPLPTAQTLDLWLRAILPNNNSLTLWQLLDVTVDAGLNEVVDPVTINVPAFAPPGQYVIVANIGTYPNLPIETDSYVFTKAEAATSTASTDR